MRTTGIIAVAAVFVASLLIFASQVRRPAVERSYASADGNLLGDPDAPIHVVEYADFQCTHCYTSFDETDGALIDNYVESGEVLFDYRPVDFLGPSSLLAAEAAYCVADQDLFWQYHDVVFTNFASGYTEAQLIDFASTLDLDLDTFAGCLQSGEKASVVEQNLEAAASDGVQGTPSYVVNGVLYGALPYADLQEIISGLLSDGS